jgi:hypothetical protein
MINRIGGEFIISERRETQRRGETTRTSERVTATLTACMRATMQHSTVQPSLGVFLFECVCLCLSFALLMLVFVVVVVSSRLHY